MTDTPDRIAKFLSRAGIASRREAERMIAEGRVSLNGKVLDSPAVTVTAADRIAVDGRPVAAPDRARLWLYHKPEGLVTSASDEKGRDTVFDHLPEGMPRVMPVGRLDLTSEGLLLLTNDGELKRRLELPATGWLRKYKVRVNGRPTDAMLEPLRQGITVEGERFLPMTVTLDRAQGANAWLTVALREGRNREIRRAMVAVGLYVNRLIRTGYGPFRLGDLAPGAVEEIKAKVLRDQLGLDVAGGPVDLPEPARTAPTRHRSAPTDQEPPARGKAPRASRPPGEGSGERSAPRGPDRTAEGQRPRPAAFASGKAPRRGAEFAPTPDPAPPAPGRAPKAPPRSPFPLGEGSGERTASRGPDRTQEGKGTGPAGPPAGKAPRRKATTPTASDRADRGRGGPAGEPSGAGKPAPKPPSPGRGPWPGKPPAPKRR